jgi:L-seryl-tRNA(Ser) seleniumtransferase
MTDASLLRHLPAVDRVLETETAESLCDRYGRQAVADALRARLEAYRAEVLAGADKPWEDLFQPDAVASALVADLESDRTLGLRRVINGTGIILHTGLGRAPLSARAIEAISEQQRGYSLLEIQQESGERGKREARVVDLLQQLTGAEMAVVVNNNAAATFLALTALAKDREVIVSRGQLVEIGESFRIPDVMTASGATMVEVGTTNKTHLSDYRNAITDQTGILLRVHSSNYRVMGFTEEVPLQEMVSLAQEHDLYMMDDLGSGSLVNWGQFGLKDEPTVQDSLASGADVVTFSGDKLLGGPQAGILVGKRDVLMHIRRHPLYRAMRLDKLVLTALEATLLVYTGGPEHMTEHLPNYRMVSTPLDTIKANAEQLATGINAVNGLTAEVIESSSQVGGGSIPAQDIPTWCVAVTHAELNATDLSKALRMSDPIVFARIHEDRVLIDPRTFVPGDTEDLLSNVEALAT